MYSEILLDRDTRADTRETQTKIKEVVEQFAPVLSCIDIRISGLERRFQAAT
jgi:hypothetical protein